MSAFFTNEQLVKGFSPYLPFFRLRVPTGDMVVKLLYNQQPVKVHYFVAVEFEHTKPKYLIKWKVEIQ